MQLTPKNDSQVQPKNASGLVCMLKAGIVSNNNVLEVGTVQYIYYVAQSGQGCKNMQFLFDTGYLV